MNHKHGKSSNAAHRHTRNLMGVAICIALMVLFAGRAMAQLDQGAIIGVVQDSTGAVIPNADVTLTAVDTGLVLRPSLEQFHHSCTQLRVSRNQACAFSADIS